MATARTASGHGAGPCMLHNPSYDFNDELIPLGGSLWVRLAGVAAPMKPAERAAVRCALDAITGYFPTSVARTNEATSSWSSRRASSLR